MEANQKVEHNQQNAVAVVVNQSFVHYVKPLLNSIKRNWFDHPTILLFLSTDVEEQYEVEYNQKERVVVKRFNPNDFEYRKYLVDKKDKFSSKGFNDAGFFIINFWSQMYENYNNILILDADMLVLKNLTFLFEDDNFLGISAANESILPAFSNTFPTVTKILAYLTAYAKALYNGIFLKRYESLNSGVIKIGKQDRSARKYKAMLRILKTFRKYCPSDQEIIFLWTKKFKKPIQTDFRLNFQARFFNALKENTLPHNLAAAIHEAANDIHILHFNGVKPDNPDFLHHPWTKGRQELVDLYNSYL